MELMEVDEVQDAPKTELAPIERAALALESSKTEKHLLALATKYASVTVVKDRAGREQAHGAAMELTRARTAVEKTAKEARDDATKFSKAVIWQEKRLVAIIEPEEVRLKAARDVWDTEQARIKAEAEEKERARVLAITERIAAIKSYVVLANNCRTSERVAGLQNKLAGVELVDFEEFTDEAIAAKAYATHHLMRVLAEFQDQEAEAARIKAEQEAEAARLKAEREDLERRREEDAAKAKAQAEADRADLELRREELARQQAYAAAAIKRQQEEFAAERAVAEAEAQQRRAEEERAIAKVREVADAVVAERAELARMRAEIEAKSKPAPEPAPVVVASVVAEPAPVVAEPSAPDAFYIVQVVAHYWDTDTKTAARWITERAPEIEVLKD